MREDKTQNASAVMRPNNRNSNNDGNGKNTVPTKPCIHIE